MAKGIDYGRGTTNVDTATGIRFGVIHNGEVCQAWSDNSEADYGEPHCPECGNAAVDADSDIDTDTLAELQAEFNDACPDLEVDIGKTYSRDDLANAGHYERNKGACGDYACDSCRILFDGQDAHGDEPQAWTLDDAEYSAWQSGDDCDIFVLHAPYYTRAAFCSPCAPGACYLTSPCDDGERAYCFGHDWFEGGRAPYPVYSVMTNGLVEPESN